MAALNRAAAAAMRAAGASACTDITGFGLFGHLARLLRSRPLQARLCADALPAFAGVLELLRDEVIPGASERNREFVGGVLEIEPGVEPARVELGFDAQTSGGLLIAIAPARLGQLLTALEKNGVNGVVIGSITGGSARIILSPAPAHSSLSHPQTKPGVVPAQPNMNTPPTPSSEPHPAGCCADVLPTASSSAAETQKAFGDFMRSVQTGGALSEKTKELILFSLVLQSRCHPCFAVHYRIARELGITQAELDEAAWCAIALGGAPVRMFYQECLRAAPSPA
jgi:AhpD family alkylhydroperoxidase